eukprot:COSAG03_NODE_22425_length_291_cov_0.807292_2_plen_26_part_01
MQSNAFAYTSMTRGAARGIAEGAAHA